MLTPGGGARRACCEAREWNPNMPVPAGTGIDRRRFLGGIAGGLLSVYGADRLGLTSRVLGSGIAEGSCRTTSARIPSNPARNKALPHLMP